jgi:hypothetical protein
MAFLTIFVTPGLSKRDYQRALKAGPNWVGTRRRDHRELLASAGFVEIEEIDLTPEFLVTARAWYDTRQRHAAELRAAEGDTAFEERRRDSKLQIEAVEAGLLRRALFVCA